ncbi:MAG: hypothetical protein IT460_04135 [Planctomycetes bacterium]|nr:hypothetical protein [Planctomycetota bacterium]
MKIDQKTPIWVVIDPTPHSTLPDICFETTLDGLRLQFAGGLSMDDRPVVFTTDEEAHEEARNRLLIRRVASQIRLDRGVPEDEVVRVTLHGQDGSVLFEGEVR